MSGDFTNKLPASDSEKLTLILTTVEALGSICQKVVADIAQLQEGQRTLSTEVRADILQLREGQMALSTEVRAGILQLQEGQRTLSTEVRADIAQLREGQIALSTEVRAGILQLREGQRALSTEVRAMRRDLDNRFGVMYDKLGETEIDHRNLHDRISRLELNSDPPNSQT